jgi:hypothetical protein
MFYGTGRKYYFFMSDTYREKVYNFSKAIGKRSSMRLIKMTYDLLHKNIEIYIIINRHPLLVSDMKEEFEI